MDDDKQKQVKQDGDITEEVNSETEGKVSEVVTDITPNNMETHTINNSSSTNDQIWQAILTPISIFVGCVLIAVALLISMINLGDKITNLSKDFKTIAQNQQVQTSSSSSAAQTQTDPVITEAQINEILASNTNLTFGNKNAKLHFIEFSDPSCPFCHVANGMNEEYSKPAGRFQTAQFGGTYKPPVQEMIKLANEGKASFTVLYFPGHGAGEISAQAWYCANEKGKFWDVHNFLMTKAGYDKVNNEIKNDKANASKLADYLSSVVDKSFMQSCIESGKYAEKLKSDTSLASSLNILGTPGFFVNTKAYPGAYSFDDMKSEVDKILAS